MKEPVLTFLKKLLNSSFDKCSIDNKICKPSTLLPSLMLQNPKLILEVLHVRTHPLTIYASSIVALFNNCRIFITN